MLPIGGFRGGAVWSVVDAIKLFFSYSLTNKVVRLSLLNLYSLV